MNDIDFQKLEAILKDALSDVVTKEDAKNFATKDDLMSFVTKNDLKNFATKEDLKNFATKEDLNAFATKDDLKNFATKEDLNAFATKDDLRSFAAKDDLEAMQDSITQDICSFVSDFIEVIDQRKADKDDVMKLADRVTRIEEKIAA